MLKVSILFSIFVLSFVPAFSQSSATPPARARIIADVEPSASPTPVPKRVIVTNTMPPKPAATPVATPAPRPNPTPASTPARSNNQVSPESSTQGTLGFGVLKSKIAEAKRQMQTRPLPTAMTDSFLMTDVIRIAFHDWDTRKLDYVAMTKDNFLSRGAEIPSVTSNGKNVTVRIIRANGVNTPVFIFDENNRAHLPLLVQYPIVRGGQYVETAYYISTHPGIVNIETVNAGKLYVRNTLDIAREKLREKGIFIQPRVVDIAERLAIVEHVDHYRFWNEHHNTIYNEIYALFALNEGGTYRYSVSSAGAGGMVQMIPSTYRMIRSRFPSVNLMPDFIEGMRDHVNASQAMLLYMQLTWNDLLASNTVYEALENKLATQEQLIAAGYNSNPAKLPLYIRRGKAGWANLIPRETKIYLQIYESMERYVAIPPRTK